MKKINKLHVHAELFDGKHSRNVMSRGHIMSKAMKIPSVKLLLLMAMCFCFSFAATAQVTISPAGNPATVVPMGDSLTFTLDLYSGTAIANGELEVTLPAGFELLTTTPNFRAGSLSGDKLKGRVKVPVLAATTPLTVKIYVKALCNVGSAVPEASRKITYAFYASATAPTPLSTKPIDNGISNINTPILNVTFPASDVVQIGATKTRVFTLIQTRQYSHINSLKVTATCNTAGFSLTTVEVSKNGTTWYPLPAGALTSTATAYTYTITQSNTFIPANYAGKHLNYGDTLLVRETVKLNTCGAGNVNYSYTAGDGTTFCDELSNGIVTYSEPNYSYNPDIYTVAHTTPTGPATNGVIRMAITNNSGEVEATMHDMYVRIYTSGFDYRRAYFVKKDGTLDGYPTATDTVFIPFRIVNSTTWDAAFDSLRTSVPASWYAARGLSDLDGDGKYNDLKKGDTVYFATNYNYILYTGCNNSLKATATRRADLYYKTFCKTNYISFTRPYWTTASTNFYDGGFGADAIRNLTISKLALRDQDQANISFAVTVGTSAGSPFIDVAGNNLINLATTGARTSTFWTVVVLPKGLSFDATAAIPLKIGTVTVPTTSYTVSPTKDTVKIEWTARWNNAYTVNVAVKANSTLDMEKKIYVYHEYDYGNTGTKNRFACLNNPLGYTQIINCSGIELMSFEPQRTTFGWTDITTNTRVTTVAQAQALGYALKTAFPFDNVTMIGRTKINSLMLLGTNDQIQVDVRTTTNIASRLFDMDPDKTTNALRIWYNTSVVSIDVPASNVSYINYNATTKQHAMRANILPALKAAGINQLNQNDSLRIEFYTRTNTNLPNAISEASISVEMEVTPTISSTPLVCYPLVDMMVLFNDEWQNKGTSSGGTNGVSLPQAWNHNTTTSAPALDLGVSWARGGANPLTGGEYRPNGANFSKLILEYPLLLNISKVWRSVPGKIIGNETAKNPLDSAAEYTVTWANGKTYLTIDPAPKDLMTSAGSSGLGYTINMDVINFNNGINRYDSYAYDNFPTSAAVRRDTMNRRAAAINANGGTTAYPYKYQIDPLLANVSPLSSRAEWTLRITNQSNFLAADAKLPHSWLAVECPAGVLPVELRDAATGLPVPASFVSYGAANKYWIQIGEVTANPSKDYILSCTYAVCFGNPQLTVKYGMSKVDYPTDPEQGYANYNSPGVLAGVVSTNISYTPPVSKFSGRLTHIPNMANQTNKFCDTLTLNGQFTNGLSTNINNLTLRMALPAGFDFYSAYAPVVKFGNGAVESVESASQNGRNLEIKLSSTKELTSYGTAGSSATVTFKLRISCGMENGMQLPANFIGHSGCGAQTVEAVSGVSPIKIYGLQPPPEYWIENLNLVQSVYVGASDSTKGSMVLSGQYRLAQTASTDVKAIIDLPKNVKLMQINGIGLNFVQEGRRLIADLPNVATIGATYPFNLTLEPEHPEQWGMDTNTIYVRTGKVNELTCDGFVCPLMELGAKYDSVLVVMEKLQVEFSNNIKAESRYNDANTERVVIEGKLKNIGDLTAGRLNMELYYFDGIDYTLVSTTASGLTIAGIAAHDSTNFKITANIPYNENVCSMLLMLRKTNPATGVNAYLADSIAIVVPVPVYKISEVVDPICQMTGNVTIGELPIRDYSYQWSPSHFLSKDNVARPLFNYDYENYPVANDTVLKYAVSIIRPNMCVSVDTIAVPVKGIPYVQQFPDMTFCSGEALHLEFKDTTNTTPAYPTTFNWTIENGPSVGLPISGNKSVIDVASLRNNSTQPIVLLCKVTPKKNGCEGVAKIFTITVNPKPQINYMVNQAYCAGQMVMPQTLGGNLSSAIYRWEYVSGTAISGLTSGVNIIPNFIAANTTASATVTNMRAFAEYDNAGKICYSDSSNFSITIQPNPTVNTVGDKQICNGGNLSINFTGTAAGSYYWQKVSGSNIPGLATNGSGNISLSNLTNSTTSALTALYKVTPITASGTCMGSEDNFTITLYPTPTLTTEKVHTLCSGSELNLNLTSDVSNISFSWTRLANAAINGGTAKTMGNANIKEVLTSTSNVPVVVKYAVTMKQGACSKNDTISVTVNSKVEINNIAGTNAICSGTKFTFTPAATATGANITWERLDAAGIQEAPSQGSGVLGTAKIDETLTNFTANPIMVTYLLGIEKDGCSNAQQVRVIVNPTPVLSSNLFPNALCSGSVFNYTIRTQTKNATYSWKRLANAGINEAVTTGATANISEVLTNNTANPVTVQYEITTTANTCTSKEIVEVVINPVPVLSGSLTPAAICSGSHFVYDVESNTQGAVFTWRRLQNSDIAEAPTNGGSSLISERLSTMVTTTVQYRIVTEANGCKNSGQLVNLVVNPLPTVSITTPTPVSLAVNTGKLVESITNGVVVGWSSSNNNVATVVQDVDPKKATVSAKAEGVAYIMLEVEDATTHCKNSVSFAVNVGAENTATLALATGSPSQLCDGASTTLEVSITGGKAPFTVSYKEDGTNKSVTANTSLYKFTVTPPANTTAAVKTVTYELTGVTDANTQAVTILANPFTVDVNPAAKITTALSAKTLCEDATQAATAFATNITDASKVTYTWVNSDPAIGLAMTGKGNIPAFRAANPYASPVTATIDVTAYYNGLGVCEGETKSFTITVNPKPEFGVVNPDAICEGTSIDLNAKANDIVNSLIPASAIKFYNDHGATSLISAAVTPAQTTTYYVQAVSTVGTCKSDVQKVEVPVNALPRLNSAKTLEICSGDEMNYTATSNLTGVSFVWERVANANINTNVGRTGSGATFKEILTSTAITAQTVIYKITMNANGCDKTDTLKVTVNPKPVLSNVPALAARTICSEGTFAYTATANVPSTTITWERLYAAGIDESPTNGSGAISEKLTNITSNPVTVTYVFTLQAGGCPSTQEVRVVVNPTPVLNSVTYAGAICSGNKFNYTARTQTKGATYSWTRLANASITPAPAGATASGIISETLTNTSSDPVAVQYEITTTANGCSNTETVEVTVNPTPKLNSTLAPAAICSGEYFVYNITSLTPGANFSWNRTNNANIAEGVTYGGSSLISEKLTNKTGSAVTVSYNVITEASGCKNNGETVSVVVNPLPTATITTPTPVEMSVNGIKTITSTLSAGATVVGWTSSNPFVATATQDGGDPTKAEIKALAQGITTITLEIQNGSGCKNTTAFIVNVGAEVKATLTLASNAVSQICNGGSTTLEINITGGKAPFNVEYSDGVNLDTISAPTSTYKFAVSPAANTGNAVATTTYSLVSVTDADGQTVTLMPNTVAVEVNPVARITNTNILANTKFCQGSLAKINTFETNVTDKNKVSYTWTNNNPNIGLAISGQGNLPVFEAKNGYGADIEGDITVIATYNGTVSCQDVTTAETYKITVHPKPEFMVAQPEAICAGNNIDLNAKAADIVHTVIPATCGTKFYCEASCQTEVTAAITPTHNMVYYAQVKEPTTGCVSIAQAIQITVNTVPTVDTIEDQTLCNNSGLTLQLTGSLPNTVYKWVRTDANTNVSGLASSGTNVIYSNRLVNNTTAPQIITIEVTPECTDNNVNCVGNPMSFDVTINPTPVLNVNLNAPGICSGSTANYTLGSATTGVTYHWERLYVDGIAEAPQVKTGNVLNETLTNLTQKTINVRYAVTLEIGNCTNTQYVTVPVYPIPVLSSSLNGGKICSGTTFSYMGQSAVIGATIQWKRLANGSIAEAASGTLAAMPINEVLTNTTTNMVKVQYEVTTTANGCTNTETVEMYVGPKLALTSTLTPAAICSGKYFNYTATTAASGVQFSWTRDFNADIQTPDAYGNSAKINERLVNLTNAPVQVSYNVTMKTAEGCEATEQVNLTVNPLPVITAGENPVTIAMGGKRAVQINDAVPANGSVVSSKPSVATAAFNTITGEMTVTAVATGYTELTYTTSNAAGCTNTLVIPVTVTDGPMATIALTGSNTVCSGGTTTVQITDIVNGKGPWDIEINYVGSTAPAQVVTISSKHELPKLVDITLPGNTTTTHQTVIYKITKVTDADSSMRTTHAGVVNITELPVPTADPVFDQSICNGSYTDAVYFTGAATNYRWTIDKNIGLPRIGQGDIPSFLASHGQANDVEATVTVTPVYTYNSITCVGATPMTFKIKVKTVPVIVPALETQVCQHATEVYIPYTTADTALEYRVVFTDKARDAGFHNMTSFVSMPEDSIQIAIAEGIEPQRYHGTIEVRHAGCSSFSSYPFTIYVLKELVITEQPASESVLCGDTAAIELHVKATGIDLTYQWYKDGQPIAGATSAAHTANGYGKYTVEVGSKCGTIMSETALVRPNEAVIHQKWDDILYVSNRDTSGGSLQFVKYQWYKVLDDGRYIPLSLEADAQDYQEHGGLTGTYAVEVFYINGTSRMSCPFTVIEVPKTTFKVYPNPATAKSTMTVALDKKENKGYLLELLDMGGRKVMSLTTKEELTPMNLDVPRGVYTLRVTDSRGEVMIQKIVVQ